jgi:hypothetical protein
MEKVNHANRGAVLLLTGAPQRELWSRNPLGPGPVPGHSWTSWAQRIPNGNTTATMPVVGEVLSLTSAPQSELRDETITSPWPVPVHYWTSWALRIPTEGTTAFNGLLIHHNLGPACRVSIVEN